MRNRQFYVSGKRPIQYDMGQEYTANITMVAGHKSTDQIMLSSIEGLKERFFSQPMFWCRYGFILNRNFIINIFQMSSGVRFQLELISI